MINQGKKVRKTSLNSNRSRAAAPVRNAAGMVRIIGGSWKRTPLTVADREGLRPTSERVRETVFDWLGFFFAIPSSRFLDMFAGSGAMGLEAASRGAARVDMVELDGKSASAIKRTMDKVGAGPNVKVHQTDAFRFSSSTSDSYDVVFIDPPFDLELQKKAVAAALKVLGDEGMLYVESPQEWLPEEFIAANGLTRVRKGKAGAVRFELLARQTSRKALMKKE